MNRLSPLRRLLDAALLVLLVAVAFLLGSYELKEPDIWWHLRGGGMDPGARPCPAARPVHIRVGRPALARRALVV